MEACDPAVCLAHALFLPVVFGFLISFESLRGMPMATAGSQHGPTPIPRQDRNGYLYPKKNRKALSVKSEDLALRSVILCVNAKK
ncbi:hypothetical protein [Martelella alba]|uniref:Secreted protein n=1 Tax=Martelella alba TaxID=2590451 RepID=A0ABY2SQT3_9HYPH|nr:hypothetical protein [Martelella alba]TKI08537.1 hypothetical protein FCN80_00285 [Martelella alba]